MKLKAVEVVQILVVVKAIREGKLNGDQVATAALSEIIDRTVEGEPEVLTLIKEMVNDIDAGFLGGLINSILERFKAKESDESKENTDEDTNES